MCFFVSPDYYYNKKIKNKFGNLFKVAYISAFYECQIITTTMKKIVLILACLSMLMCCKHEKGSEDSVKLPEMKGTIKISGAFALLPLVQVWTDEYSKKFPEIKFEITSTGSGQGIEDILSGKVDLGMISSEVPIEHDTMIWLAPVAKLGVIVIINNKNPYFDRIIKSGLTRDELSGIFSGQKKITWGDKFGNSGKDPMNVYCRSDKSGATDVLGKYLWLEAKDFKGQNAEGELEMLEFVKGDPLAIGYCNLVFLFDSATKGYNNDFSVVPIDMNSSGKIEEKESIYNSYDELAHAIWSGKYPCILTRDLSLGTKGIPSNPIVKEFLKWVMTDGQVFVEKNGYTEVRQSVVRCKVELLKLLDDQ